MSNDGLAKGRGCMLCPHNENPRECPLRYSFGHWVNFGLDVLGRFKIGACAHIFDIVNHFLSWVKSGLVTISDKFRFILFVLNTSQSTKHKPQVK